MRTVTLRVSRAILETAAAILGVEGPQVFSPFTFEPPSLHELYDVAWVVHDGEEAVSSSSADPVSVKEEQVDSNELHTPTASEAEANAFFPDEQLQEAAAQEYKIAVDGLVELGNSVASDLKCYEEVDWEAADEEDRPGPFHLDYPPIPGVNCRSCFYHLKNGSGNMCSLCYLRSMAPYWGRYGHGRWGRVAGSHQTIVLMCFALCDRRR